MVGYDYTFFDKNYLELDGGIYDDPDISISEAVDEILQEEGWQENEPPQPEHHPNP